MATKLSIVTYPEKILRRKAGKIAPSSEIQKLVPVMIKAMYHNEGIGLAAPQIGISKQIIIVESSHEPRKTVESAKSADDNGIPPEGKPLAFLNPRITKKSKETDTQEEGCLSLPGLFVPVKRAAYVELSGYTSEGQEIKIEASGLMARIFQHEVDHLNGKLIIDRISPVRRLKLRTQLKEIATRSK